MTVGLSRYSHRLPWRTIGLLVALMALALDFVLALSGLLTTTVFLVLGLFSAALALAFYLAPLVQRIHPLSPWRRIPELAHLTPLEQRAFYEHCRHEGFLYLSPANIWRTFAPSLIGAPTLLILALVLQFLPPIALPAYILLGSLVLAAQLFFILHTRRSVDNPPA